MSHPWMLNFIPMKDLWIECAASQAVVHRTIAQ